MKKKIIIAITFASCCAANAQVKNYSGDGERFPVVSEKTVVTVTKQTSELQLAPILIAGIGAGIDIGMNSIQAHLNARQEKFTASYTGKKNDKGLVVNNTGLALDELIITRKTKADAKTNYEDQSTIKLKFEQIEGAPVFKLKLQSIFLNTSKAMIAKRKASDQFLDLNIDIKIDALWYEFEKPDEKNKNVPVNAKLESATLGQSSITVSGLKPGVTFTEIQDLETDWFKMVPPDLTGNTAELRSRGWYTVTVTVKEANSRGVSAKKIADFFKENKDGITTFLKSFIPEKKEDAPAEEGAK